MQDENIKKNHQRQLSRKPGFLLENAFLKQTPENSNFYSQYASITLTMEHNSTSNNCLALKIDVQTMF